MANFRDVNRAIKAEFPNLDIQAVRGEGYVYFDGSDGFDKIVSVSAHPVSTSTETMIRLCIHNIKGSLCVKAESKPEKVVYESNPSQKQSFVRDKFVGKTITLLGIDEAVELEDESEYSRRIARELRLFREKHGFVFERCPGREWGTWQCKRLVKPSVSRRIERLLKLLDVALYGKLKRPHWHYAGCCIGRDHRFSAAPFRKGEIYTK